MGPRTSIRGNGYKVTQELLGDEASMGPRTSIRGNVRAR